MAKSLSPAKQLESAARIAIVLLPLGSEERIALARALNALAAPTSKLKCWICEAPIAVGTEVGGFSKKLKPIFAHETCAQEYRAKVAEMHANFDRWNARVAPVIDMAALAFCACSHAADSHTQDELENLLACSECDCDHFHYQEQAAA